MQQKIKRHLANTMFTLVRLFVSARRDFRNDATVRYHTCPWFRWRIFWKFFVNYDCINYKNSTVIELKTCVVNVLWQLCAKYCIVKVFVAKCNLSIKFINHSSPYMRLWEGFLYFDIRPCILDTPCIVWMFRNLGNIRSININNKSLPQKIYRNGIINSYSYLNSHRHLSRSRWPRSLWRGSAAVRLLGFQIRIPQGARMSVSCECCVLSGSSLCDGPITRPEKSYRLWVCHWL
jgi:hypothetical protein